MQPHSVFDALQLAVSPVILISACGLLLLSMTNRLGRAIDRARNLVREPRGQNRDLQIKILIRRANWIRSAILFTAVCIFLTAILVLLLFLSVFLPFSVGSLIVTLFVFGLLSLVVSVTFFIMDVFSSLRAMEAEIDHMSKS